MGTDRVGLQMAIRLDENNREIEMQKLEIRRLREQAMLPLDARSVCSILILCPG